MICDNYRAVTLLCTTYNILVNIVEHQLFIDLKKAYDSVRREVLYNIFLSWYPLETSRANKNVSEIGNGLKQGDALLPLFFNFALEYSIRRVQVIHDGLKVNGTHQHLVCG